MGLGCNLIEIPTRWRKLSESSAAILQMAGVCAENPLSRPERYSLLDVTGCSGETTGGTKLAGLIGQSVTG
jgi:hypothetical protein